MTLPVRLAMAAFGIVLVTAGTTVAAAAIAVRLNWIPAAPDAAFPRFGIAASIAAMVSAIPVVAVATWLGRSIRKPLDDAASAAEAVLAGHAPSPLVLGRGEETERVLIAIVALQQSLANIIASVVSARDRLATVEADTTAALHHEETAIRAFGGSAQTITAAVTEISATSEQLHSATGNIMARARDAARVADEGRDGLDQMAESIQHLDEAMNAFASKLATISQRAAGITTVVTTIAKVAEQTNLLSVNATIEAEKAGEAGRGFRIVAQEIRRLADQTAQSTKDIERLVRDMQAAVASGTMEMDRFRNEVSTRMSEVKAVSGQLGRIIAPVQAVTDSLEQVHEGMATQSEGARQIRLAMESLREDVATSAGALDAFATAIRAIRGATADLDAAACLSGGAVSAG